MFIFIAPTKVVYLGDNVCQYDWMSQSILLVKAPGSSLGSTWTAQLRKIPKLERERETGSKVTHHDQCEMVFVQRSFSEREN